MQNKQNITQQYGINKQKLLKQVAIQGKFSCQCNSNWELNSKNVEGVQMVLEGLNSLRISILSIYLGKNDPQYFSCSNH